MPQLSPEIRTTNRAVTLALVTLFNMGFAGAALAASNETSSLVVLIQPDEQAMKAENPPLPPFAPQLWIIKPETAQPEPEPKVPDSVMRLEHTPSLNDSQFYEEGLRMRFDPKVGPSQSLEVSYNSGNRWVMPTTFLCKKPDCFRRAFLDYTGTRYSVAFTQPVAKPQFKKDLGGEIGIELNVLAIGGGTEPWLNPVNSDSFIEGFHKHILNNDEDMYGRHLFGMNQFHYELVDKEGRKQNLCDDCVYFLPMVLKYTHFFDLHKNSRHHLTAQVSAALGIPLDFRIRSDLSLGLSVALADTIKIGRRTTMTLAAGARVEDQQLIRLDPERYDPVDQPITWGYDLSMGFNWYLSTNRNMIYAIWGLSGESMPQNANEYDDLTNERNYQGYRLARPQKAMMGKLVETMTFRLGYLRSRQDDSRQFAIEMGIREDGSFFSTEAGNVFGGKSYFTYGGANNEDFGTGLHFIYYFK